MNVKSSSRSEFYIQINAIVFQDRNMYLLISYNANDSFNNNNNIDNNFKELNPARYHQPDLGRVWQMLSNVLPKGKAVLRGNCPRG